MRPLPHSSRDAVYAGSLLGHSKAVIRNTATAITETATPVVRQTLTRQLQQAIHMHEQIFNYMLRNNLYPAYNVQQMIQNDVRNANQALDMPIPDGHSHS